MAENLANGLPDEGRSPESGYRMAAEGMPFSWWWDSGTISTQLPVIWGMSVYTFAHLATASAGITFLMEKNHNEEDASHVVSRLLEKNNLPTPEGGGHSPSKKLTAWRDEKGGAIIPH